MEHNNYASNSDDDEKPGALWDFEDAEVDSPVMFALEILPLSTRTVHSAAQWRPMSYGQNYCYVLQQASSCFRLTMTVPLLRSAFPTILTTNPNFLSLQSATILIIYTTHLHTV